ncbi:hypothetical protein TGUWTKB_6550 [Candidatus Tachikawaea gelatinosa]|uniref:Uncharacterized protein n=1 Tax=Candidatus Tachikawaea gelatinosa TaxID=1410383 RepID=A0A090AMN9_9ENTR|nr:hypothetical protein TGUWTKB_6550 [Candidatus Tachikawaea gelatinosa]
MSFFLQKIKLNHCNDPKEITINKVENIKAWCNQKLILKKYDKKPVNNKDSPIKKKYPIPIKISIIKKKLPIKSKLSQKKNCVIASLFIPFRYS